MTQEEKLLISTSLLPVLADFIEDYPFNRQFKLEANRIINGIRFFDGMLLEGASAEEVQEQNDIQLAFRNWLKEIKES